MIGSLHRVVALTLALSLSVSSTSFANGESSGAPAPTSERAKYLKSQLRAVETSIRLCNENPAHGAESLEGTLASLHDFAPELAAKPELQDIQRRAVLALARAYHNSGQPSRARAALNSIYRSDPPRTTELRSLGPSLEALGNSVKAEVAELGRGTMQVICSAPCEVFVNERTANKQSSHIVGEYRVYVRDLANEKPPLRKHIEIQPGDGEVMVRYDNRRAKPAKQRVEQPSAERSDPLVFVDPSKTHQKQDTLARAPYPKPKRLAPLWLEIAGIAVGLGAAATGGVLWYMAERPAGKNDEGQNINWDTKDAGVICVAAGAATAVAFTILLIADQRNVNRNSRATARQRRWPQPFELRF